MGAQRIDFPIQPRLQPRHVLPHPANRSEDHASERDTHTRERDTHRHDGNDFRGHASSKSVGRFIRATVNTLHQSTSWHRRVHHQRKAVEGFPDAGFDQSTCEGRVVSTTPKRLVARHTAFLVIQGVCFGDRNRHRHTAFFARDRQGYDILNGQRHRVGQCHDWQLTTTPRVIFLIPSHSRRCRSRIRRRFRSSPRRLLLRALLLIVAIALALPAIAAHAQQPSASATLAFVVAVSDETIDDGESTTERVCLNGGYHVLVLAGAPHPPEYSPPEFDDREGLLDIESAQKLVDMLWANAEVEFEKQTFHVSTQHWYRGLFDLSGANMLLNTQASAGTTTW